MKFLKKIEVKRNIIRCDREVEQLCVNVKFYWGTSLHNGDTEKFLRNKLNGRHGRLIQKVET